MIRNVLLLKEKQKVLYPSIILEIQMRFISFLLNGS